MNEFRTINECRQGATIDQPGHSKGKPDSTPLTYNIAVRFATLLPETVPIRRQIRLAISGQPVATLPVWLMTGPAATTTGNA